MWTGKGTVSVHRTIERNNNRSRFPAQQRQVRLCGCGFTVTHPDSGPFTKARVVVLTAFDLVNQNAHVYHVHADDEAAHHDALLLVPCAVSLRRHGAALDVSQRLAFAVPVEEVVRQVVARVPDLPYDDRRELR